MRDADNGAYNASYTPEQNGVYRVDVRMNSAPIKDSPFRARIWGAVAGYCVAHGDGLEAATAGSPASFVVVAKTESGVVVALPHGGAGLRAALSLGSAEAETVQLTAAADTGHYDGAYTTNVAGTHRLSITLDGKHIHASPFAVLVRPQAAYAPMCFAEGPGLARATQLEEATFTVHIRDRCDHNYIGHDCIDRPHPRQVRP